MIGFLQNLLQHVLVEDIDAHAGQTVALLACDALTIDPLRVHPHQGELFFGLGLLDKIGDTSQLIGAHNAQPCCFMAMHRLGGDRDVGAALAMGLEHGGIVHAVELVAGENHDLLDVRLGQIAKVLAYRVGRALIPIGPPCHSLLGGENLDEAPAEIVEAIRAADVAVQTHRKKLREHVDASQAAVDAIRERDIDQSIFSGERHCRFGTVFGQRHQPGSPSPAQYHGNNIVHHRA